MYPCAMYLDDNLSVANIFEQGLKNGILKGLEKWSGLPLIDQERARSLTECRRCIGRDHCRGGCIGRASANDGNPMTVEDRCELRREVYYYKKNTDISWISKCNNNFYHSKFEVEYGITRESPKAVIPAKAGIHLMFSEKIGFPTPREWHVRKLFRISWY